MKWRVEKTGLLATLVTGLVLRVCAAQAPIDPSLPEAPISHHRGLFLFSGYGMVYESNSPVPPMRATQKFELAFLRTVNVSTIIRSGFVSGFDEAASVGPIYGDGAMAFGQLYGYNVASLASNALFTNAVLPTLFRQDPRYFRKGSGTIKSRIRWALRSEFVAFSDKGTKMPNYSEVLGFGMSTALSDAYLPAQNVSFWKTMEGWGIKVGVDSGLRVYREFGAKEILKKLRKKR